LLQRQKQAGLIMANEKQILIDDLYEEVFEALKTVKPEPLRDFMSIGNGPISINIQALTGTTYSLRIFGRNSTFSYLSGNSTDILFTLRGKIREIMDLEDAAVASSRSYDSSSSKKEEDPQLDLGTWYTPYLGDN
jgi:hypothetical protein